MKGSNSVGLVRLDWYKNEEAGSVLLAIGTYATLDKYAKANIPNLHRNGNEFVDDSGNRYTVSTNVPWLIERMEAEGASLPYEF